MQIKIGKLTRTQKCVIYGCEGIGKSTFASKFPNPIFADLENGTSHLDIQRVEISSWEELINTIEELTKNSQGFKTFVIDTADWAERLCSAYLCKKYKKLGIEDFGYGKGYTYLAEEYANMLGKLTTLQQSGMHVVILAHSTIKKLELPEENGAYDHYELKCSKTVSPLIKEWSDGLLFANYKTFVQADANGKGKAIGGKERVLYTEHTAFCDAKNRWGLTDILPLNFEKIKDIFGNFEPTKAEETHEDETWGNVEISDERKANISLIESAMEFGGIKPEELDSYLKGNNSRKKVFISAEQTYKDLSDEMLEKLVKESNWEKIESGIKERRAK